MLVIFHKKGLKNSSLKKDQKEMIELLLVNQLV